MPVVSGSDSFGVFGSGSLPPVGLRFKPSNSPGDGSEGISGNDEKTSDFALHVVKYRRYFTEGNA